MIQGAFTSGRHRSRSQIASLLKRSFSSSSRRADIASTSSARSGDSARRRPRKRPAARESRRPRLPSPRKTCAAPSARARSSRWRWRARSSGRPEGRVLLTSMYTPALLWMYPYSHRTRANGDAASACIRLVRRGGRRDARLHRARQRLARLGRGDVRARARRTRARRARGPRPGTEGGGRGRRRQPSPPHPAWHPGRHRRARMFREGGRASGEAHARRARARATGVDGRARDDIARAFAAANGG